MALTGGQETQKPINAGELGRGYGVFQIMWRDDDGDLYVHQLKGNIRDLVDPRNPSAKKILMSIFWHLKAAFVSTAAAVFDLAPIEIEPDPATDSPIVDPKGVPYTSPHGTSEGGSKPN